MNFLLDNFVVDFFTNTKKTDEEFNAFINVKFTHYLNNTNLLANIVKDFEANKTGQSNYCSECKDLYILTKSIFNNYIKKLTIPFDININDEINPETNTNYKNKVLYFFNLEDLKQILTSEKLKESSDDEVNKKKILCKIISVIFIRIYIIIKSIHETFNIYHSLTDNVNESESNEQYDPDYFNSNSDLSYRQELDALGEETSNSKEEKEEQTQEYESKPPPLESTLTTDTSRQLEQEVPPAEPTPEEAIAPTSPTEPTAPAAISAAIPTSPAAPTEPAAIPAAPAAIPAASAAIPAAPTEPAAIPAAPAAIPAIPAAPTEPAAIPAAPAAIPAAPAAPAPIPAAPTAIPAAIAPIPIPTIPIIPSQGQAIQPGAQVQAPIIPTTVGGAGEGIFDTISKYLPFSNSEQQASSQPTIEPVKYKPSKNLFYTIFVILFTDYYELNSGNFSKKILLDKLHSIDNERFATNLSKLAKYFCSEQNEKKEYVLFNLETITNGSIIFDENIASLQFLNLNIDYNVDYKKEHEDNLTIIKSKQKKLEDILTECTQYLETICLHALKESYSESNDEFYSESNDEFYSDSNNKASGASNNEANSASNNEANSGDSNNEANSGDSNNEANSASNNEANSGDSNNEANSGDSNNEANSNSNRQLNTGYVGGSDDDKLFANYKALNFIKTILTTMIKDYFFNRRYLYTNIIEKIVKFDKKKNIITKLNDNLTYIDIMRLTHKTKYQILEMNYYTYNGVNSILKVFSNELKKLEKKTIKQEDTNIITRPLHSGYGGKSRHNKINAHKKRTLRKKRTRKEGLMSKKHRETRKKKLPNI